RTGKWEGMSVIEAVLAIGLSALAQTRPISEKYPGDVGIEKDPRVVFSEDFDAWEANSGKPPASRWDAATEQIAVVPGSVTVGGKEIPGKHVLAAWSYHG